MKEFLTESEIYNVPYNEKRIVVTKENHLEWCGFGYGGQITSETGGNSIPHERACIQLEPYNGDSPRWQGKTIKCGFRILEPHHVGSARLCFVNRIGGQWVPEYIDFTKRKIMAIVRFPWHDYCIYSEDDFFLQFKEVL